MKQDKNISLEMNGEKIEVQRFSYEVQNFVVPRHMHGEGCYELHGIAEGSGVVIIDDREYRLKPGDFFITGPLVPHEQYPLGNHFVKELGLYLKCQENLEEELREEDTVLAFFLKAHFLYLENAEEIISLMKEIHMVRAGEKFGYEQEVESLVRLLMIRIARKIRGAERERRLERTDVAGGLKPVKLKTEKMQKAELMAGKLNPAGELNSAELKPGEFRGTITSMGELSYNLESKFLWEYPSLTLSQLADYVGLSIRQTQRLLENLYGKNFREILLDIRMSAASLYLRRTDKSVTEISELIGYASIEQFSRAYRKYYGCPPSTVRKNESGRERSAEVHFFSNTGISGVREGH